MRAISPSGTSGQTGQRIQIWYVLLLLVFALFGIRLFYIQIIQHEHYRQIAIHSQLKEYELPAERGTISAREGDSIVPIVLNEKRYTLFADPAFVKDPKATGAQVASVVGGQGSDYEKAMRASSRYVVLAKKLSKEQKQQVDNLKLKGIGTRETSYRTYPEGNLAAQLLGFVNDDNDGKYGIEQALDHDLKGTSGELKAITDAAGVPLVSNKDNIITAPVPGKQVVLTINVSMQRQLEDILKAGLDKAKSTSGSALVIDPNSGAVLAMANYPTYNPAEFYKVDDANVFNNAAVSSPLEIGSTMKPLTAAAALDLGVVNKDTTYYDPSHFSVDNASITNIEEDGGAGTRSIADILQLSLNTGATWLLMQMGGGQINQKARTAWHDYMANHYQFGKLTGIEQGYESGGTVPDPNKGYGLNIQYANTAFGQGMTATPLQLGAALSSVINGGTYYQPHLVDGFMGTDGKFQPKKPNIVRQGVVKSDVSNTITQFMGYVVSKNYLTYGMSKPKDGYIIGGKTGTAQIAKPTGGYYDDRFNGTFMGFVGGAKPQYVIVVRVNEPHIGGYAGSKAAAPIFGGLSDMLINNFGVLPKS